MREHRAAVLASAIVTALALMIGSTFAADCIIASRSIQGNTSAGSHSQVWCQRTCKSGPR
jgi:hypothetical protein